MSDSESATTSESVSKSATQSTLEDGEFELVQEGEMFPWEKSAGMTCCSCLSYGLQVVLCAAQGSFLFGLNLSLLNTAIGPIKADMQWCKESNPSYFSDYWKISKDSIVADHEQPYCEGYIGCSTATWYESFVSVGVFVGAAVGSLTAGNFLFMGRRTMMILFNVVFAFGIITSLFVGGFASILWARLCVGYAVGLASFVVPMYIAEMSPKEKRGTYGVFHQLFITVGIFIGVLLGIAFTAPPGQMDDVSATRCAVTCGQKGDSSAPAGDILRLDSEYEKDDCPTLKEGNEGFPGDAKDCHVACLWTQNDFDKVWWRIMLGLGIIPVCVAMYLLSSTYAFETPHYYVENLRMKDAEVILRKIAGDNNKDVTEEIKQIHDSHIEGKKAQEAGLSFFSAQNDPEYRFVIWTGLLLSAMQQFSGINIFIASSNKLFSDAGLSGQMASVMSIVMTLINCLMTFPALPLIERMGRKSLLLMGTIGQTAGVAPAAIMLWVDEESDIATYLALIGAIVFIIFFAVAYGPVLWVFLFEIYPAEIKGAAAGAATAMNWVAGIVMVFIAPLFGNKVNYTIFMVMSFLAAVVVMTMVKETKGRSIDDSPYFKNKKTSS